MHIVIVTMGTDGDVFPFIGLGATLRSRGHRVTFAGPEPYQPMALQHGFHFSCLVSRVNTERFLNTPDLWHPVKSGIHAARWGARLIQDQYDCLQQLTRDKDTVLVSNAGIVAARLVQEKLHRPMATVLLQPGLLPSVYEPPVMPVFPIPAFMPKWMRHVYWRAVDTAGSILIGKSLNRIRKSLGLSPVNRFFRWWLSPQLIIGMFPSWYAALQPDWPLQLQLVGFPQFDGVTTHGLPADLVDFCRESSPPIAFTTGTGMMHGQRFFEIAVEVCSILKRRGILLTRHVHQLPTTLPPSVCHVPFAPFQQLFPLCSVIVHHGGIGTTARALAAGKPQVIMPLAWDQPDNAARICKLGVGAKLSMSHRSASRLATSIENLLTPEIQIRCKALTSRFEPSTPFDMASDLLERFDSSRLND